jgi:hypothetical protein
VGREDDDTHVFARKSFRAQIDFLKENVIKNGKFGLIYGQPGSGKSLASFFVAGLICRDWIVIWIHVDNANSGEAISCDLVIMRDGIKSIATFRLQDVNQFLASRNNFFGEREVLFLDGASNQPCFKNLTEVTYSWWKEQRSNRRLVHVSSLAMLQGLKSRKMSKAGINIMAQYAWTRDEYNEALSCRAFAINVAKYLDADTKPGQNLSQKLDSKFFYAGGSARYMFNQTTSEVKWDIQATIHSASNINYLHDLASGYVSNEAWHTHLNIYDSYRNEIISAYAAFKIAFILGPLFIRDLVNNGIFSRFPYVNGGAFELYFFSKAQMGALRMQNQAGKQVTWETSCSGSVFHANYPDPVTCVVGEWLIPSRWNQPGFDGVFLGADQVIRFVQITRKKKQGLKLEFFRRLIDTLEDRGVFTAKKIEIFFIVPRNILFKYTIGKIQSPGLLSEYGWPTNENEVRDKIQILGIEF